MEAAFLKIPLTQGKSARVSPEDFPSVSQFKWCASGNYAARGVIKNGRSTTLSMHRFILGEPSGEVDHKDGNGLNNTRENLHVPSKSVNKHRRHIVLSPSGYRGVYKHIHHGYAANIKDNYKTIYLGLFPTREEAALAYDRKALELHGENAMTNFMWQKKKDLWTQLH